MLEDKIQSLQRMIFVNKGTFFVKILALMIGGVFAGYTATDMHPDFLKKFETWPYQFITFFLIAFSFFDSDLSKWWLMVVAALFFTAVLRLLRKYINKYHQKEDQKENAEKIALYKVNNFI
uniref:Uncharacterized protein n=1 Tax=viral metagenome TaxID=1070528 RepID=A0A6C0ACF1_9ZZZZ